MDWPAVKQYVSQNTAAIVVGLIITLLVVPFLKGLVKWPFNYIRECLKRRKQNIAIQKKLLSFTQDQIQKQINSRKYLPDSYIEINQVKEGLRYFCHPFLFCNKFIDHINRRDFTYTNSVLGKEIQQRIAFKVFRKLARPSLKTFKAKLGELNLSITRNAAVLNNMPEKSNDFPWQARWKMEETIAKFNVLKSRVLVLLDDAGQGKTNLICDLTKEFLLKLEVPVALFYGGDFYGLNNSSMKAFVTERITGGTDFDSLNKFIDYECRRRKTNFIIIIDALNESSDPNFPSALNAFIGDMLLNPFVRIILTCRTEYYDLNFKVIQTASFAPEILKIKGINSKLEEHEKDKLFRKYLSFFNIEWKLFAGRVYEKLVSNFLLLRIFCEAHQGRSIGSILNVYMLDLFQEYYRQIRDGIKGKTNGNDSIQKVIREVVKYMVDSRLHKDVPMQVVIDKTAIDKNVILKLIDENIFFRRDVVDKTGVLLDGEVISFTFDEIRDFLIADYLANVLLPEDEQKFTQFITDEVLPQKPLFEGVSKYLFFISKKDRSKQKLNQILAKMGWWEEKYLHYLFETNDVDLTDQDVEQVKREFLSSKEKAEFILKTLIYYRYDPNTYKNLNITMLFPLLIGMSDADRLQKFDAFLIKRHLSTYSGRDDEMRLEHYFEYINEIIKAKDINNPALEFLFFIASAEKTGSVTAKNSLSLLYREHQVTALAILEKYQNCNNEYYKNRAHTLINEVKPMRGGV
ncbi:MAG: hypothetical protein M0R66_01100 [Candidatus Omnitrophica bacterium]|nr:hypothetical protein [Candidatus Omnitrophota bacterium]